MRTRTLSPQSGALTPLEKSRETEEAVAETDQASGAEHQAHQGLHKELHAHGIKTFQRKYRVNLAELAREYTERWLDTAGGKAWQAQQEETAK